MAGSKSFALHYVLPTVVLGAAFGYWRLQDRDKEDAEIKARNEQRERDRAAEAARPAPAPQPTVDPIETRTDETTDDDEPYTDEMRKGVAINLNKLMREQGADVAFQSEGTVLLVLNLSGGGCDVAGLKAFRDLVDLKNIQRAGFTKLRCSPRGGELSVVPAVKPAAKKSTSTKKKTYAPGEFPYP